MTETSLTTSADELHLNSTDCINWMSIDRRSLMTNSDVHASTVDIQSESCKSQLISVPFLKASSVTVVQVRNKDV